MAARRGYYDDAMEALTFVSGDELRDTGLKNVARLAGRRGYYEDAEKALCMTTTARCLAGR